jgi:hypothetical protein
MIPPPPCGLLFAKIRHRMGNAPVPYTNNPLKSTHIQILGSQLPRHEALLNPLVYSICPMVVFVIADIQNQRPERFDGKLIGVWNMALN